LLIWADGRLHTAEFDPASISYSPLRAILSKHTAFIRGLDGMSVRESLDAVQSYAAEQSWDNLLDCPLAGGR
jgi:hypothetical protein